MKKIFILITILFSINSFSQEINLKEYSYTQLFGMITKEKDSVFILKDALIVYNAKTDSLLTTFKNAFMDITPINKNPKKKVINKELRFSNVHFTQKRNVLDKDNSLNTTYIGGSILNIHFKEKVIFNNVLGLDLNYCIFEKEIGLFNNSIFEMTRKFFIDKKINPSITISKNVFKKGLTVIQNNFTSSKDLSFFTDIYKNTIYTNYSDLNEENIKLSIRMNETNINAVISDNSIKGSGWSNLNFIKNKSLAFVNNQFTSSRVNFTVKETIDNLVVKENNFSNGLSLDLTHLKPSDLIQWKQFNNSIISANAFRNYTDLLPDREYEKIETDSFTTYYKEKLRFQNLDAYSGEAAFRGALYRHYRENFDMVSANAAYMNLKDFETKHLEYMYELYPSFDTYFQWKVNQFLKVFSDYGTKPSKAITFSVYVIFVFALIYLFFPNSWDRHGKNRILDRYRFFLKYMNKDAGIHEVYLDDCKSSAKSGLL